MRTPILGATFTEYGLHPFNRRCNRPRPKARLSATLAAEKRAHICQNDVGNVEYHLEWPESKSVDSETPREPSGVAQIPKNLRNRFASELHRSIGHEDMNRRVGIPYVEFRIEQYMPTGIRKPPPSRTNVPGGPPRQKKLFAGMSFLVSTPDKFECIGRRRSAWCKKAELSRR